MLLAVGPRLPECTRLVPRLEQPKRWQHGTALHTPVQLQRCGHRRADSATKSGRWAAARAVAFPATATVQAEKASDCTPPTDNARRPRSRDAAPRAAWVAMAWPGAKNLGSRFFVVTARTALRRRARAERRRGRGLSGCFPSRSHRESGRSVEPLGRRSGSCYRR